MRERWLGPAALRVTSGALLLALVTTPIDSAGSTWPSRATMIERKLSDGSAAERLEAARALSELSPSLAAAGVRKGLADPDLRVRLVAAKTAVFFGLGEMSPLVLEFLKSQEEVERQAALEVLGLRVVPEVVPPIASALTDPDTEVRVSAAIALGRAQGDAKKAAETALLAALDDGQYPVRIEAAASLGRIGSKEAALTLAAHLQDPEPEVRQQLALALGSLGEHSVTPALLVALSDPEDPVVAAAASSLGYLEGEEATFGLTAVAEQVPFQESGQRAIEALVRRGGEVANRAIMDLLSHSDRRRFIESVLVRAGQRTDTFVADCLRKARGEALLSCVRVSAEGSSPSPLIFSALDEGRLTADQVLITLAGKDEPKATILALEQLSTGERNSARAALAYLFVDESLPVEAEGPLRDSLNENFWGQPEVAAILFALSNVSAARPQADIDWVIPYLESTEADVRAASARLIVSRGVVGSRLSDLVFRSPKEVQQAALSELSEGASQKQASEVVAWLADGTHGNRKALLSLLPFLPGLDSKESQRRLRTLWDQARGAQRDALLPALARSVDGEQLVSLLPKTTRADRTLLAQLSWYVPGGHAVARELVRDEDSRIVELSLTALGLLGNAKDHKLLLDLARGGDPDHPTFVRAAAWNALTSLALRKVIAPPVELLPKEACASNHLSLRAAALQLFALGESPCGDMSLSDVLALDQDVRIRATAARVLRSARPNAAASRRCAFYERRAEVARYCGDSVASPAISAERKQSSQRDDPPYEMRALDLAENGLPRANVPLAIRFPVASVVAQGAMEEIVVTAVSDRDGRLYLPAGRVTLMDESWAL